MAPTVVHTAPTEKRCLACATEISVILFMLLSLPHFTLDIFATGKQVNHGGEYGLEIPADFHFYGPEKAIKLAKK